MKLCRFIRPEGTHGWGIETNYGIQDISQADPTLPESTFEIIANWDQYAVRIESISRRFGVSEAPLTKICPLDRVGKILCIGLNYRDHAIETGQPIPEEPIVFCKMPQSMLGPGEDVVLPKISTKVDYEAELVVVLGKTLKNATEEEAKDAIFGYTCGNDVSARDWQTGKPGKQWFLGKSFDTFAPIGPSIALRDSIETPTNLQVQCRINGETFQDGSTNQLIFSPWFVASYISQVMTLSPGDLIFTGTPPGVGVARKPPRFLAPGDQVEIEIESIGVLKHGCV